MYHFVFCFVLQGKRLLEIKCPYTARESSPAEAINQGIIEFVKKDPATGQCKLDSSKRGYFHQIQTALAVSNLKMCDLVVWTPKGLQEVKVPFDPLQWGFFLSQVTAFFEQHIIPAILRKKGLGPRESMDANADPCESQVTAYHMSSSLNVQGIQIVKCINCG